MNPINDFIESGILELFVMGVTSPEETQEVELMAAAHPEIREEIETIRHSIEAYAIAHAVEPSVTLKPLVLATIDYMERMKNGEPVTSPPTLTPDSKVEDFADWLNREDLKVPSQEEEIYVKIIGYSPSATTAIVWLQDKAGEEVHHDEHERFLIVEGTCTISVEDTPHYLTPGDFFSIPLHKTHSIKVTSEIPCKVILQRLAA
ncbi:cupin domain-containing protein [Rufibacter latericius]|uniref:Cupin domain-containing protein n=1 Tax=Rufibacter latericius TaxID=2487040 RepID=A0A3M9MUE4_9BACT|nr:cupin domain-containing protein [Rufibacter latericius]RNI29136.1 cupin domain-containing protein [Rufibacter latericius]